MADKRKTPLDDTEITGEMCSPDLRLRALGQVPFFAALPPAELQRIYRQFREQGFGPDEMIYFEEDPDEYLYVVAASKVKLIHHTAAGKDMLLDLLNPGEYLGSLSPLANDTYTETAQVHTSVCTLRVDRSVFRTILTTCPDVALRVLEITAQRLHEAHEKVRQLSACSVEHRIALTLLKLADKFGEPQKDGVLIQTPLSRVDLAEMTGTTTESASRAISQLQKAGLIETGRQWVSILDRDGFAAGIQAE